MHQEIRICSLMDAINVLSSVNHYTVISIRDSCHKDSPFYTGLPWDGIKHLLPLYYDDIIESDEYDYRAMELVLPSRIHVEKVKHFFLEHQDSNFLTHCFAGRSRSSAVAVYLAYLACGDPLEALFVLSDRHSPNLTFMKYASELEDEPLLYELVKQRLRLNNAP